VTGSWITLDDSAVSPGDFNAASGTVTFPPGQTTLNVAVTVNGDTLDEQNERFFVSFRNPVNATMGGIYGLGFANIADDDPKSDTQVLCESYSGTFGNTNMTAGSWPTIVWTCNGYAFSSETISRPSTPRSGTPVSIAGETATQFGASTQHRSRTSPAVTVRRDRSRVHAGLVRLQH
jgi:hypothetical protein